MERFRSVLLHFRVTTRLTFSRPVYLLERKKTCLLAIDIMMFTIYKNEEVKDNNNKIIKYKNREHKDMKKDEANLDSVSVVLLSLWQSPFCLNYHYFDGYL